MSDVLMTPRIPDDDIPTADNASNDEPINFWSMLGRQRTQSAPSDQFSAESFVPFDAEPDDWPFAGGGYRDASTPENRRPAPEIIEPEDDGDHGSGTPMWALAEQSLTMVEEGTRHVLSTLMGHQSDPESLRVLSKEVDKILEEIRIQGLVMEGQRQQTSYGLAQISALQHKATHDMMAAMVRIKELERLYPWAETPQERAELADMSAQLRAQAREMMSRTLDMGIRRIDEQIDRPLHPAHPDFPERTDESDSDAGQSRSLLSRVLAALRAFSS